MSRVNVEEGAFGDRRLARFERLMGWDRRTAMGCLVMLWHDSQALMRVDGSEAEIADWCWALTPEEGGRLVAALEAVGYLSPLDNGLYLIHGNETQLENLMQRTSASAKGGAANRARWEAIKASRKDVRPKPRAKPDGIPPDSRTAIHTDSHVDSRTDIRDPQKGEPEDSSMQSNAGQCNAGQCNADTLAPLGSIDLADFEVGTAWLEYAQAEMPWQRAKKTWTPEAFAHEVGKVRRSLGMTETGMAEVLAFVRGDAFWRDKACSPSGLLKKSQNGNRKIDNVLLAMKSRATPQDRNIDAARRWAEGS